MLNENLKTFLSSMAKKLSVKNLHGCHKKYNSLANQQNSFTILIFFSGNFASG